MEGLAGSSRKNSEVKRVWLGVISGWVTDREVLSGCAQVRIKCAEKTYVNLCPVACSIKADTERKSSSGSLTPASGRNQGASATKKTGRCRHGGKACAKSDRAGTATTAAARSSARGSTSLEWRSRSTRPSTSRPGTPTATARTRPPVTAAGSVVEAVKANGFAAGVARGGVPLARIAVYKSLWKSAAAGGPRAGNTATVLAAIDDAIHDRVDILSLSLVVEENSFGALHAVQKEITVVYAAGNLGPTQQVVLNTAPWVITQLVRLELFFQQQLSLRHQDRSVVSDPTVITLGNRQQIVGQSLHYEGDNSSSSSFKRLVFGGLCTTSALNGTDLRGKIVLCMSLLAWQGAPFPVALRNVLNGGGSGLIFAQHAMGLLGIPDCTGLGVACILVDLDTANLIVLYMDGERSPVAKIASAHNITGEGVLAPKVAAFSSRGPSIHCPEVIKVT
ncbi:hypothetical protein EJB05_16695, partial [Eragrostis curvula]